MNKGLPNSQNLLISLFTFVIVFFMWFFTKDYLVTLILATVATVLTFNFHQKVKYFLQKVAAKTRVLLLKITKNSPNLPKIPAKINQNQFEAFSAIITVIISFTIFTTLLFVVITFAIKTFANVDTDITGNINRLAQSSFAQNTLRTAGLSEEEINATTKQVADILNRNVNVRLLVSTNPNDSIQNIVAFTTQIVSTIASQTVNFIINFIIFIIAWILMLINGESWLVTIYKLSPFDKEEQKMINKDLKMAFKNVLLGNFLSGLSIALLVMSLCIVYGLPYTILLMILGFLCGFLPLTPSELAFVFPIALIAGINPFQALIAAVIIEVIILFLNNYLLPKVTAGEELNPLIILLAVLSAINFFGIMGFIIGPSLAYIMNSFVKITLKRKEELHEILRHHS